MANPEAHAHRSGPVRSDDARRAILEAVAGEFLAKGYEGLTIQGVAAAAHVGKQTIYRWWGGKAELVADCLVEGLLWDTELAVVDTGDVVHDVTTWIAHMLDLDRPGGRDVLRSLLGAAASDEPLAQHLDELLRGAHEGGVTHRLTVACERGELDEGVDTVLATDVLLGLVVVRTIVRRPTTHDELDSLVRQLLTAR
ncbi:TetR/AcrR family transcriptional regulator [Nocardioides sp. Y6]|uniref:TetR/AcrR family transcriptional regulator n=1 Tax=Nocardioides malaquae TaxID=2773426 RepID=A0ABR9RQX3_9ACTN|nr:TetR/AcrR family transcriptional regulator [Nocardioides malaquae]MBE7323928.1 TetR/AcrR family transcriptional regulator [Nocardioides malaquae]